MPLGPAVPSTPPSLPHLPVWGLFAILRACTTISVPLVPRYNFLSFLGTSSLCSPTSKTKQCSNRETKQRSIFDLLSVLWVSVTATRMSVT